MSTQKKTNWKNGKKMTKRMRKTTSGQTMNKHVKPVRRGPINHS